MRGEYAERVDRALQLSEVHTDSALRRQRHKHRLLKETCMSEERGRSKESEEGEKRNMQMKIGDELVVKWHSMVR